MMDDWQSSLIMLTIERACAWTQKYDNITDAIGDGKSHH